MSTLGTMKQEIADDLGRSDLSSYIATCISRAIEREQTTRYWFNESRDLTFSTVAGTYTYDTFSSGPVTSLDDILTIDYLWVEDGTSRWLLENVPYDQIEASLYQSTQSKPYMWTEYGQKIWLYPIPNDAYTIRASAHYKVAEPSSDTETGNVWMTDGYSMIMNLAKAIIYSARVRDLNKAQVDNLAYQAEKSRLIAETNRRLGMGTPIDPVRF